MDPRDKVGSGVIQHRQHIRPAQAGAGLVFAMLALFLAACTEVQDRYAPRSVTIPEPVGAATATPSDNSPIKPIGARPVRTGTRLTEPVILNDEGVGFNPIVRRDPNGGGAEDVVTLSFVDTDIRDVVEIILGQTLNLNYVYDDRVEGLVTARTSEPIAESEVLPVLQNILALNGAALVDAGGVLNVVPVTEVGALPKVVVTPSSRAQRAGIGTYVIPLQSASVESVSDVANSLVSPGNQLAVDVVRNMLIYTGPATEAQALTDLVNVLDVDVLSGKSFGLFPIANARAVDVASELESVFDDGGFGGRRLRFLPIERLNAVLAVAPRRGEIEKVRFWVEQFDRSAAVAERQVYVYNAKAARADELVDVLRQVFLGAAPAQAEGGEVAPGLSPIEILRQGGTLTGERDEFDEPAAEGAPGLRIVADKRNNAVVIIATADEFRLVEATLRQIDILPLQVLIEATIAEVTLNDDLEYGLQWAFANGDFRSRLSTSASGQTLPSFPGFNFIFDTSDVRFVLSALAEVTDVNVVSSPQLVVLDNQSARLQVGDQVPIQVGQTVTEGGNQIDAIEYVDTGVILEVTPRVNASGLVTLEINQEVSDAIVTQSSTIDSPTIRQREISSIVSVQSGQTIALGGLIRERASGGDSGLPVLKDIPVLGNAFKTTSQNFDRTELLVLITPRVIRGESEARDVTEELRKRLTTLQFGRN